MSRTETPLSRPPGSAPTDPALKERDERLESLKAVIGKLAHDFNNLLVPLLGYVTLIREEVPEDSSTARYATSMENAARKSEGLIETILLAVRPQRRFTPQETDLAALVRAEVERVRVLIPANAGVQIQEAIEPCEFYGDPAQWANVAAQLLDNARFALATGGRLTVTLTKEQVAPELGAKLGVAPGEAARLVIADTGFGMSPDVLKRACEPFYSTRSGHASAGLGLTVAHSVALWHGGQMQIESRADEGTTVTVWIPLARPAAADKSAVRAPVGEARAERRGPGRRILLVEDDPLVREVTKTCLLRTGRDVHVAQDGEEGLRLFKKYAPDWALVVSDITMPRMTGLEMGRAILALAPETRFVFVSGDADPRFLEAFPDEGTRPPLLRKPFSLKAFSDLINEKLA